MQNIDPKTAARVWERVHAPPKQGLDTNRLLPLIREEWLDIQICKHLGLSTERSQETLACLKGICRILTGSPPRMAQPQWRQEKSPILLRQSFDRRIGLLAQYEALQADPTFGPVFSRLAAVSLAQACKILESLGQS